MPSHDLTAQALEGFGAALESADAHEACPYYTSSPNGMAWLVGAWMRKSGLPAPRKVRMSRGYTVRADDMLVSVANASAVTLVTPPAAADHSPSLF